MERAGHKYQLDELKLWKTSVKTRSKFQIRNNWNKDESVLFYRKTISLSYLSVIEDRPAVIEIGHGKQKERVNMVYS